MNTDTSSINCSICRRRFEFAPPHLDEIEDFAPKHHRGWMFVKFPGAPIPTAVCGDCVREFVNPIGLMLQRAFLKGQQERNHE